MMCIFRFHDHKWTAHMYSKSAFFPPQCTALKCKMRLFAVLLMAGELSFGFVNVSSDRNVTRLNIRLKVN